MYKKLNITFFEPAEHAETTPETVWSRERVEKRGWSWPLFWFSNISQQFPTHKLLVWILNFNSRFLLPEQNTNCSGCVAPQRTFRRGRRSVKTQSTWAKRLCWVEWENRNEGKGWTEDGFSVFVWVFVFHTHCSSKVYAIFPEVTLKNKTKYIILRHS